jgi:hypothetical protein
VTPLRSMRLPAVKLARLREIGPAELKERLAQKVAALLESRGLSRTVHEPSDAELWRLLDPVQCRAGLWSGDNLQAHFRTRTHPGFFHGVREGAAASLLRGPRWDAERAALIAAADRICDGVFDLLGHTGLSFGTPIDWHLDPTTNRRSPALHWSRIPYLDAEVVGDHKVVWELNRHQHLVVLGRAYQVTGGAKYAGAFATQLTSWMNQNPPKQGVNWASSLEIAYRAISWLWAIELFQHASELDAGLLKRLLKFLYLHGRHLERYLSTYFSPNTHLTGEALGLFYLGTLLPELKRSTRWSSLGWSILERELPKQVYDDGVYFEQATYYHRYTVDIYLHAVVLARLNGRSVSAPMTDRLSAAAEHLADLTRPDGTIPLIGDDDGGTLLRLDERPLADVSGTLGTAAATLGRDDIASVAGSTSQQVVWMLGPKGADAADRASKGAPPTHLSRLFPVGGYAVMRDGWGPAANHAVIDCGPHGTMNCGHAHADALSMEITALGCPVFVDPGTYTYVTSAADRDGFRHSAAHNTVTLGGRSSSIPSGAFSWSSRTDAQVERWWSGSIADWFVGSHSGFGRPDEEEPIEHRRSVLFVREGGYWVVVDSLSGTGAEEMVAHWHVAIGASVDEIAPDSAVVTTVCRGRSARVLFHVSDDVDAIEWGEDWVSPVYGARSRARVARVVSRRPGSRRVLTVIAPIRDGDSVAVRMLPRAGGHALEVDHSGGRDLVLFGPTEAEGVSLQGDAALIKRTADGAVRAVALFGSPAKVNFGARSFEASQAAEARLDGGRWVIMGDGTLSAE